MLAEIDVLVLPYSSIDGNSLLNLLINEFSSEIWTNFKAAVAFCKQTGTIKDLLDAMQTFSERGGEIEITFGADTFGAETKGSDYEAIETILTKFNENPNVNIYLYHEKSRTFHPKIYLFSNEEVQKALLIVGSSNWSEGGFINNIEVDVIIRLDLKKPDHLACYNKIVEHIEDYWQEQEEEQEAS